jgi:hypothetical protein
MHVVETTLVKASAFAQVESPIPVEAIFKAQVGFLLLDFIGDVRHLVTVTMLSLCRPERGTYKYPGIALT